MPHLRVQRPRLVYKLWSTRTQVWGMTEASRIATRVEHPESDITGAVGRPIPNVDMKLVDDNGKDLGEVYGTRGEICL